MILRLCDRKRWTLTRFFELSAWERAAWIAWERQHEERVHDAIQDVFKPGDDGTLYAETVSARALIALLQNG